jgi:hypothetical protein
MSAQDLPAAVPVAQPAPLTERPVSLKRLAPNLLNDQKRMWLSPLKLNHPANLAASSSVIGATAALVALDPMTQLLPRHRPLQWFQRCVQRPG